MRRTALAILALALVAAVARAAPLFELEDGGQTFVYRARPGDHPGRVAEMFGIPADGVQALLKSNGIRDDTQVGSGFVYRVPNVAARELTAEVARLREERDLRAREATEAGRRAAAVAREARSDRDVALAASARAARSQRLDRLWPFMQAAIVLLALAALVAVIIARAAVRRQRQAERYARSLATELEDRRKTSLAERQEAARRVLDLEQRVRTLESQVTPRRPVTTRAT
jgi:hypothetical protein